MKKFLVFAAAACVVLAACKKDGDGTKPTLSFASFTPNAFFAPAGPLSVTFNVADGDGDITDTLGVRLHFKSKGIGAPDDTTVWIPKTMPDIGANKGHSVKGQVQVDFIATELIGYNSDSKNDSLWITAYIQDKAGHRSDTITTPKIPIIKE